MSLKTIARSTAGFSGADLENLVNEAALLAARRGKKAITEPEIEEASVKVMMGPEKKSHVVTDDERRLVAYHETGHAITGYFGKHHDPVHQISIISRGGAGGYTMYLPEKDPSYVTKTAMFENIVSLLLAAVLPSSWFWMIFRRVHPVICSAPPIRPALWSRGTDSRNGWGLLCMAAIRNRLSWAVILGRERDIPKRLPRRLIMRSGILWMKRMKRHGGC